MRCNNCGWDNQHEAAVCIKCNTRLEQAKAETKQPAAEKRFGKTISDHDTVIDEIEKDILISCLNPDCGYLNPADALFCARCKAPLISKASAKEIPIENIESQATIAVPAVNNNSISNGTIDPYRAGDHAPACRLTLVPRDGEINGVTRAFTLVSDSIELNRDNLDQDNNTITGKIQAELFFENGKWQIQNKSELKTTFIQVSEKMELKDGDVILMGNRKFIFSTI